MELTEPIESINKQLVEEFGIDSDTGRPMYRIVSSWDQYEKRLTNFVDGMQLLYPEVRELPKYPQNDPDYKGKYILERLVIVPIVQMNELPSSAMSYEPLFVFMNGNGEPIPPAFWASKFVIDSVHAALGKSSMAKYVDEEMKNPEEERNKRIHGLMEELFGDESILLGRTVTGEAVGYTGELTLKQENTPVNDEGEKS